MNPRDVIELVPVHPAIDAATVIDWGQVRSNTGDPCFYVSLDDGRFCLRGKDWAGHHSDHAYSSLLDLLCKIEADRQIGTFIREIHRMCDRAVFEWPSRRKPSRREPW